MGDLVEATRLSNAKCKDEDLGDVLALRAIAWWGFSPRGARSAPHGRVSLLVAEVLPPDSYLLPTVLVAVSVVDDGLNANATAAKDSSSRFKASPVRGAHDFRLCRSADQQDAGGE